MGHTSQKPPQIPSQQQHEEENREFTCQICIEPMLIPEKKFKNTNKCSHPFCTDCIIKYIRARLEYSNAGTIKCPAYDCHHTLDPCACAPLIGPNLFLRWCDVLCEESIVDLDKCYCPYRNCSELIVNECGENVKKKSNCPNCRRSICFECKKVWHAGSDCEDSYDVAFMRLAKKNKWMRCPQCRHFVELREGCHMVRCRCRIDFCYNCGRYRYRCNCIPWDIVFRTCFLVLISIIFIIIICLCFASLNKGRF